VDVDGETGGPPSHARVTRRRRSRRPLLVTLAAMIALIVVLLIVTGYWTDLLWFRSVGYTQVFLTRVWTRIGLFLVFGLLLAGAVVGNMVLAYRVRPPFYPSSPEQEALGRSRAAAEPYRLLILIGSAGLLGLAGGAAGAGHWQTWLLWRNATAFGVRDAQFGRDVSFFAFSYPWWRFLLSFGFAMVVLSLLAAAGTHYLYGGLRLQTAGERTTPAAHVHLSLLLGLFVLLKAIAYWLDRYGMAVGSDRIFPGWTGLKYVHERALLPAKTILFVIALICAVLFFANAFRRTWLLPGIGLGLLVLSAVLIGGVYPAAVQRFAVRPSEADREAPYIARSIEATRSAYGIENSQVRDYAAKTSASEAELRRDAETTASIRLLDPSVVSPTYQQLQQVRGFYGFAEPLDVDRYVVGGRHQDAVVAVRELDLGGLPAGQRSWINERLRYTHGFGFVAARGNVRQPDGKPSFLVSDIPPTGGLGEFEPRIYFGERSPTYSIVGAPPGSAQKEIDYPDDSSPTGQRNTTYSGTGGVPIGTFVNRLLYTMHFREEKILLTSDVNAQSKILYFRHPRERVERVAPWLTLDGNTYPAVVGGRIVWIVDGYTTSNGYPYSSRVTLQQVTADSLTTPQHQVVATGDRANYVRNSVKATVDAYDGTVTLYAWDASDPVLKTWMKVFPGAVKPRSQISDELLAHLRYPEDLFKIQREILTRYHVTDPQAFYGGQDFWRVPDDPTSTHGGAQPGYYLTLRMPDQNEPTFSLTTTLVPANRPNLAAFVAVNAEPGEDYGTIRVLQLRRNTAIPGPGQTQNNFSANSTVAQVINLLRRGDSDVVLGNLLTLPVGGGLLYVEPVYVKARSGTSYPLLQKVLVGFGDKIAFEDTLPQALDVIFGGSTGTAPGQTPPGTTPPGQLSPDLQRALSDAQAALDAARQALRDGNIAAWFAAQQRLQEAVERAVAAQGRATGAPSPAPAPSR
jgi:uncharacterized membrane protein (UPF0182 family)